MPGDVAAAAPLDAATLRAACRAGRFTGETSGCAPGALQANVVIVAGDLADRFEAFCSANPQALPLIARSAPGSRRLDCGADVDVARDAPRYRVWRDGRPAETVTDAAHLWKDDSVGFALGCWLSNEAALAAAGVRMRHLELGVQGALFRSDQPATAAAGLCGPLVLSMRPFAEADVARVAEITARDPRAHGAPVHAGDPAAVGVRDLSAPDWGAALPPAPGETAMFWACGLTGQEALARLRPPLFVTHEPGCMLVTDLPATP